MQGVAFAEGDDAFNHRPRGLGTANGGGDALLLDDVGHQIAQRGAAMRGVTAQLRS